MEVSRKVMRRAAELLDAGVSFALCTVVAARGSVPGKTGAKMIVLADGAQFGTVGGAGLEEKTKVLARRSIAERRTMTESFELMTGRPGALDSLCGGAVDILVEYMGAVPKVLIRGGGPVAREVARLCDQLEYLHASEGEPSSFSQVIEVGKPSEERTPAEMAVGIVARVIATHKGVK